MSEAEIDRQTRTVGQWRRQTRIQQRTDIVDPGETRLDIGGEYELTLANAYAAAQIVGAACMARARGVTSETRQVVFLCLDHQTRANEQILYPLPANSTADQRSSQQTSLARVV